VSSRAQDPSFADWIDDARAISCERALALVGGGPKGRLISNRGYPCPACGGRDRFSINTAKNLFFCRNSGASGDGIALVEYVRGCNFLSACEILTGRPPPDGKATETQEEKAARKKLMAEREARHAQEAQERAWQQEEWREKERRRAHEIWTRCQPFAGTLVEAYFAKRGQLLAPEANLRFDPRAKLWSEPDGEGQRKVLHEGPAIVAGVIRPDGSFGGIETIWIDLDDAKGHVRVFDPVTGEMAPAKKMRGTMGGGFVRLARAQGEILRIVAGEGLATVNAVRCDLAAEDPAFAATCEFRACLSLDGLGGKSAGMVRHPSKTITDRRGHLRPLMVRGPVPKLEGEPVMAVPGTCRELILLRDGDSDPFSTRQTLERAAARFAHHYPFLTVRMADPGDGMDFDDLRQKMRGAA